MDWLMNNWEYKVIAVFFAIALFFYTSDLISIEQTLQIRELGPEQIQLPEGYIVTEVIPAGGLEVDVRGPKSLIQRLSPTVEPLFVVDAERIRFEMDFPVTVRQLGLDPKIRVIKVSPVPEITVRIEELLTRAVPVNPQVVIQNLPEGLTHEVTMQDVDLLVRGPSSIVADLGRLETAAIDLGDVSPDLATAYTRRVELRLLMPAGVHRLDESPLYAEITVRPQLPQKNVPVPVLVAAQPEVLERFDVVLSESTVIVPVTGPQALLEDLRSEQLKAHVVVSPQWPVEEPQVATVQIQGPKWFTYGSVQVKVTLQLPAEESRQAIDQGPDASPPLDDEPAIPLEERSVR